MASKLKPPAPPPRLALGDPASIAYRDAYEDHLERLEVARIDQERYEARSDAQFHRWQRHKKERYPPQEVVTDGFREEITAFGGDGCPSKRDEIIKRVREKLVGSYSEVPLAYVVRAFETLAALGHIRLDQRRWTWSDEPLIKLPDGPLEGASGGGDGLKSNL